MPLNLVSAHFINRAPFENLVVNFKTNGINVLSSINGKGKTTIITYIADAFHEMLRAPVKIGHDVSIGNYYRDSETLSRVNFSSHSIVYLRFQYGDQFIDYIDLIGHLTENDYQKQITLPGKIPFERIVSGGKVLSSNYTDIIANSIFDHNLTSYYPAYRYEVPGYLSPAHSLRSSYNLQKIPMSVVSSHIERITVLDDVTRWVQDVVLDEKMNTSDHKSHELDVAMCNIINIILKPKIGFNVRLGLGNRHSGIARVSVIRDQSSCVVYPSIFNMSSGEVSLVSIFYDILRQADKLLSDRYVSGIVLIDEVDKHLHILLQKEILPRLFKLFPNIQFIVSAHSPFLNIGLEERIQERMRIIDLDNNGIVTTSENSKLYREVYDLMISERGRLSSQLDEFRRRYHDVQRPMIVTEGKTDWKHLKAALRYFKSKNEYLDLDVDIVENNNDFGDSKLNLLLEQYKQVPPRYKVIGVFDCDEGNGRQIHLNGGIKTYSENVYGISLPIPYYREYNESGISVEFLYQNEDLLKIDENGRRLYVTSEFGSNGRLVENALIGVKNHNIVKNHTQKNKEKIVAADVIHVDGASLALSKEEFATNILEQKGNYAEMDFAAFRLLFDRIHMILYDDTKS